MLSFVTLGETAIYLNGERVEARLPAKAVAMLVYLADHGGRASRTSIAGLLWSDQTEDRARANLRVALTRLRSEVGAIVDADREWVQLATDFVIDVTAVENGPASAISSVYSGDFLSQSDLAGAGLFNDWLIARQADIRSIALHRMSEEANRSRASLAWNSLQEQSRSILAIDRWNEQAHCWMIEALHVTEGGVRARAYFDSFAAALEREIGVQPLTETIQLVEGLTEPTERPVAPLVLPVQAQPPRWPTRLLGRESEIRKLLGLAEPGRPVSIVGPGGMGKSRLLAEFAERRRADGKVVAWIGFDNHDVSAASQADDAFAKAALVALGIPANTELGPVRSLNRSIGKSEITLCLDNLELLHNVEQSLSELQRECPELEIVLTTRRMPSLVHGRVLYLDGLPYETAGAEVSVAAQLFLDRTSRSDLDHADLERVSTICAALQGHPLAIELAAHWAKTGPVADLVDLVGFSPSNSAESAVLQTEAPDLPERHRSLEAIVATSVAGVSDGARRVLRAGSVFAGPFTKANVKALLPQLTDELEELVAHSLVSLGAELYRMHPVIRRFARTRIESVDSDAELAARHAHEVVAVMETMANPLTSGSSFQRRAADFRLAIDWMIDHAPPDELPRPLARYLGFQRAWGWIEASHATIDRALSRADLPPVARAELHRHAAEALLHSGDHDAAADEIKVGLALVGRPLSEGALGRVRWNARQLAALSVAPLRMSSVALRARAAERARLMSLLGEVLYVSDRRLEMMNYGLGSLSAGRVSRDPVLKTAGDAAISIACQLGGVHRLSARYRCRARSRSAEGYTNQFTAAEAWGITAVVALGAGEWADARADCAIAVDAASSSGRSRMISQLEILAALIDYHECRFDDALLGLKRTEVAIEQHGFRRAATWVDATRAEVLLATGGLAEAVESASAALTKAIEAGRPEDEARAHAVLARCHSADGDLDAAHGALQRSLVGIASPSALAIQHFEFHCGIAECAVELHRMGVASEHEVNEARSHLRSYAKSFPIARSRLQGLATL